MPSPTTQPSTDLTVATDPSGTQAAIDAGTAIAAGRTLGEGLAYAFTVPAGGHLQVVDRDLPQYRTRPRRKTGHTRVTDATAFTAYHAKHALPETEVYADLQARTLTAVINAHQGHPADPDDAAWSATKDDAGAGWGDHRLTLGLHTTPGWDAWAALDRALVTQVDLAEHFEERLPDFVDPSGADMLELAQTFQASTGGTFSSSHRLSTGAVELDYRDDVTATGGKAGRLTIPETFTLALTPFLGGDPYRVTARFRYRLTSGTLRVGYLLTRPDDVIRDAFTDQVTAVRDATGATVLNGTPTPPQTT